ncbi:DNA-3-methyladenine glycosylase [Dyadobacter psychrophilus]|uniref:Putative 3-methyladenine DNA glycosylase n=1 Tax=Dyadobacter psychrophilus TaxID=651661 RepID=A0A1T5GDR0_9BACT|nr:DNA-3-methyladenine glycosylase [Dyadobacter psychrophilus]SKC06558.1 DNA-3-methyladenine glycosylase [Dyadobacter psychrophilus]
MTPESILPLSFYSAYDTRTLAEKLIGCELVHESPDGVSSGIIVETEAYLCDDPACHAYNRRTTRTEPMYGIAGTSYVYLIYGMYECFNVVSNKEGIGEAVLIRALQPVNGIELMELRRQLIPGRNAPKLRKKPLKLSDLCKGPGNLARAMGIERSAHNNILLDKRPLYINDRVIHNPDVGTSKRIGINVGVDSLYRFYLKGNIFVSKL